MPKIHGLSGPSMTWTAATPLHISILDEVAKYPKYYMGGTPPKFDVGPPSVVEQLPNDDLAEIIDDIADRIERDGWVQGFLHEDGHHCTLGAINVVLADQQRSRSLEHQITKAILDTINQREDVLADQPDGWTSIPAWNDEYGRTQQQVLDTLRYTAKRLRLVEVGLSE